MADYPNRSDLRTSATSTARFTGQTYGQAAQQAQSQQAVRPGRPPTEPQPSTAVQARPRPGAQAFGRPSERPNEPITAGSNFGPGPNMAQAGIRPRMIPVNPVIEQLKILNMMFPNDELGMLIRRYSDTAI